MKTKVVRFHLPPADQFSGSVDTACVLLAHSDEAPARISGEEERRNHRSGGRRAAGLCVKPPNAAFVTHETSGRSSRVIARIMLVLMAG